MSSRQTTSRTLYLFPFQIIIEQLNSFLLTIGYTALSNNVLPYHQLDTDFWTGFLVPLREEAEKEKRNLEGWLVLTYLFSSSKYLNNSDGFTILIVRLRLLETTLISLKSKVRNKSQPLCSAHQIWKASSNWFW
jgi:hypothetical protein